MCHTGKSRFQLFVKKIAPIQINFLGYPGTSGSKFVIILLLIKLLSLNKIKNTLLKKLFIFQILIKPMKIKKKFLKKILLEEDFGLPNDKFVFCSFNQNRKMNPKIFGLWMNILFKSKDSVLWINE